MYKVKVKFSRPGYKGILFNGIYVPKEGKSQTVDERKTSIKKWLCNHIRMDIPLVDQYDCSIVEFTRMRTDFFLDENKQ